MKLENVIAEIRPRSKWESVDLGVALVQRNFGVLMVAWGLVVAPLFLICLVFSYFWYSTESLHYGLSDGGLYRLFYGMAPFLFVWWLKPIYERVLLFVISRLLFGEKMKFSQLIGQWKELLFKDFFRLMILQRISMQRCFTLPITVLEGLKGKDFKKRVSVLNRNGGDGAASLTTSCVLLAHLTMFTFYVCYVWLTMYGFQSDFIVGQVNYFFDAILGVSMSYAAVPALLFALITYMFVLTIFSPFYVGAGFALYINSRTVTEGWDVELAFKRMSSRLVDLRAGKSNTLLSLAVGFGTLFFFSSTQTLKAEDPKLLKQEITTVMDSPEFDVTIETMEHNVYKKNDSMDWDLSFLGPLLLMLFYVVIVAAIGLLIYFLVKNAHVFRKPDLNISIDPIEKVKARSVMGMDITKESLPDDIITAARGAWEAGDKKLALSYLYRGSIAWMVDAEDLPILESDTEQDCIRHVQSYGNTQIHSYFSFLTNSWVNLTYGKILPADDVIQILCEQWPFGVSNKSKGGGSNG